ncbi:hypothetical protein F7725_006491 [Dissostichus mawsoni]|uniref:Neural cell adhesion molecule 1 n=1 Tax=Dissostichus mawsoni TaxID=36200 RepID=A0A7J5XVV7_DISMA|nr:hypothetical protein F7725_006491 [Dissostichus mawsoni]
MLCYLSLNRRVLPKTSHESPGENRAETASIEWRHAEGSAGFLSAIQVQITPTQGEISVGESKFFLCEVTGDAKDIDWYSPSGEKILPNRPDIIVSRGDETMSTLTIYHANVDSAGIYKCVAKNGDKEAQATVQVKIFQKITFESAPSPQEFNEGDDAASSATIIWKHKGSKIQAAKDVRFKILDNGHLQIRGIKKIDEGMYNCEARVARGEIDFKMIKVVVNVLPTIRARVSDVNATADNSASALLACDADGFPEPTVTWAHNNIVLETGDKYSLNEDGSELMSRKWMKEITLASPRTRRREIRGMQPKITYLSNQTASEFDEQVTLTCEASGDPTPSISWSFETRVFTEGEQASWTRPDKYESLDRNIVVRSHARVSSLTLKNVLFTYAGKYLCSAGNSIGQDEQHMFLEILGSVTVYTWERNSANISCEVEAHPAAAVLWFRDGLQLPSTNTTNMKIYNTPSVSYLEITPDSQNDFGSYNCTASNVMGSESKEFLLIQAEIQQVDPFSSTAVVSFEEPDSMGGVPIIRYRVEWHLISVTITGLKPETTYEVKMSAINGKGEGESSAVSSFTTEPVREPSAPKLEVKVLERGNSLKVNWIKQDDGGSPIKHYLVRYKAPEIRMPRNSEYVTLSGLDWNTEYEVYVVAENQQGKSEPGVVSFRTASDPTTIPDAATGGSGMGTGAIVGILIVVFFLLLVGVDVTCYFLNKCGLLMKDESKEPIVEVRTEEENTPNQGGGPTEPNETTPLTDPEPPAADSTSSPVVNVPPPSTANNSESFSTAQSSPVSESTTTLTISPTKAPPKNSPPIKTSDSNANPQPDVGPLVDLSETPKVSEAPSTDSQVDGPNEDAPKAPSTDSNTPAQNDGKIVKDGNTKVGETEVKNATAEVKTVPSEAPQTNGNESKA